MTDGEKMVLFEERLERLQLQQDRFESHFDSEARARDSLKDRAARIETKLERIENKIEENKDDSRWSTGTIISVVSNLIQFVALMVLIYKQQ